MWTRPIGTAERPAVADRQMGPARLLAAHGLRGRATARGAVMIGASAALHAAALHAVLLAPAPGALELGLCGASYAARMFGITAGYHRYFAHRSFECGRGTQLALGVLGAAAWQRGPLWWAAHHHEHHAHSDTARDPHSPVSGSVVWAHLGWMATPRRAPLPARYVDGTDSVSRRFGRDPRASRFPEIHALDRHHAVPGLALLAGVSALDGAAGALWGFAVPTVLCWHATFMVNSVCHAWGERRFQTGDASRNNALVALLTFGEGWHNNHHMFAWSAAQGLRWYELDLSFAALRALERCGLVWNLKVPTAEQVARVERKNRPPGRRGASRESRPERAPAEL